MLLAGSRCYDAAVPNPDTSPTATPAAPPRPAWLAEALIWAGLAACAIGFGVNRMWLVLPLSRFGEMVLLAGLVALLAWPLRRWLCRTWAEAFALPWLVALAALTGLLPALSVLLLSATAIAIGSLVAGRARPLLSLLSGFALIAGIVGWLLPLPIHRAWVYIPLCVVAIVLRRRALLEAVSAISSHWRMAVDGAPRTAAAAVMVVGIASAGAWPPTMMFDDLAYHLGLPWQLMVHGAYTLDPSHQVWTLAAWGGDVLQAIAQVMAHAEARSALNAIWLLATAAGVWQLCTALGARMSTRWAAVALYASLPLTQALQGSMQTETAAAAVTLGLALAILDDGDHGYRGIFVGALLFGLLCTLKPLHALAALPLLVWALWRHWPNFPWRRVLPAALLVLLVGASSYTYSWIIAGNPILPLFNNTFHSAYFPAVNFNDTRWHLGLGPTLPWRITFDTEHYYESWDGGFGFVMVALAGAWLLALARKQTRALAWVATAAILLPLLGMQYARYIHPSLVLLIPVLLVAMQYTMADKRLAVVLVGVCVVNLAFQANANWMLHIGSIKDTLTSLHDEPRLFARFAPERALAAAMREQAPRHGTVLSLHLPAYAEFAGLGRTTTWYDPALQAASTRANLDASGEAWAALWRDEGIGELMLHDTELTPAQRAGLVVAGAQRKLVVGDAQWWRLPEDGQ